MTPLLLTLAVAQSPPAPVAGWVSLFNGRDLSGWTPKIRGLPLGQDPNRTFRVEGGLLKVRYDQYEKFDETFGHLFHADPLSHYRLKVEYRFVGDQCPGGPGWATRNSGVMLHCQPPDTMGVGQDFPVSIEVQFLGGLGKGKRTTGNLCTPGTNVVYKGKLHTPHCTNSQSDTFDGDRWVTAEVEVLGDGRVTHFIDGKVVLEYEQPQLDPADKDGKKRLAAVGGVKLLRDGHIALQAESHPCDFRSVQVRKLK